MARGNYYGVKLYDADRYAANRPDYITYKGEALDAQISELNGVINLTKFSQRFLASRNRGSHNGCTARL